ncbi:cell division protein DedD [Psychromonas marina]|uniref:Cell division protein DedD n=1 Tax=Psychromonas marina TaxID=88364 RepID=A0ABQ6E2S1_9GAMM|nr:SPOR domain-containing protein [Psychromonas marina]GLS91490.1 cell division protein DedD [Psychromonas marina]
MASQFQNRLVGISILVACVVIFLPSIIDGKKMAYEDEFVATPIHPALKTHSQTLNVQDEPISSAQLTDGSVVDEQWQVEEVLQVDSVDKKPIAATEPPVKKVVPKQVEKIVKKAPVKPTMPESAWTIQLGAFQNASNINSLLKTLHKAGYQAHTVPTEVIDGKLTRLFVGPDVSKKKLEQQLPRLKRLTKLEGKLLPFDAVNP